MRRSKLPFPLISDREGTFAERFGAWDAQRDCIRRTTIVIRCGFSHAAWASDIARRIDVSTHGDDLIRRSEGENRSRVHHRLPPGQSIHEPCYREGLLRVTILGPGRLAENPELIRSGKPPILFDGTPVESLSELRRALLQSFDPRRHPGELGFDGITPRPPIAASDGSLHAASARPLRIDCEWDQVFGWTQAVTLCATRLPGESLDSLVRESPRVLMMEWGTRGAPSWIRFPDSMGFVDPTVHDPMAARLVLEVSPDERAYDPPSRRVAFYVDDDARPLGYCFGMRLVPSDPAFCSLTFARLRDAEMILDPPDLVRRIDARLGRRRSRHIEFHCSPFVCHGLVDELFSMVGELRRSEVTLRTLPGLFAELEAGRIR